MSDTADRVSISDYDDDALLRVGEAAAILRVSDTTALREMKAGRLPFVRIGRRRMFVRAADLREFIHNQRSVG